MYDITSRGNFSLNTNSINGIFKGIAQSIFKFHFVDKCSVKNHIKIKSQPKHPNIEKYKTGMILYLLKNENFICNSNTIINTIQNIKLGVI